VFDNEKDGQKVSVNPSSAANDGPVIQLEDYNDDVAKKVEKIPDNAAI
jgi:hypothetical protein